MSQESAKKRIGIALRRYVAGTAPSKKYADAFGCDSGFLRAFLEHQFSDERMSRESFGKDWSIGHVIPVSGYDQENPKEMATCWNWINLRATWNFKECFRPDVAVKILDARFARFPGNPEIVRLLTRAKGLAAASSGEPDWSTFDYEPDGKKQK